MDVDLKAGIVRILKPDGTTAGTGFVASEHGLVVTCSHIVQYAQAEPGGFVSILLYATGEERRCQVVLEYWRSPNAEDVAVLRSDAPLPDNVTPLLLGSSGGASGHSFKTLGFPDAKSVEGMWGYGTIGDRTMQAGHPMFQLTSTTEVTQGFSDAPVLDNAGQYVVGMVNAITIPDRFGRMTQTAFITPAETLWAVCPLLLGRAVEAVYRDLLRMIYGFWEDRFVALEMAVQDVSRLGEDSGGWIPPSFSVLERIPPGVMRVKLPLPNGLFQGLQKYKTLVLLGEPGSGKTTALSHLAGQLASDPTCLPLPVSLRYYTRQEYPLDFIRQALILTLQDDLAWAIRTGETDSVFLHEVETIVAPIAQQLEHLLERGQLALLLDGLNEMPNLSACDPRLSRLVAFVDRLGQQGNRLVITCRERDYHALGRKLNRPLQEIHIEQLDDNRIHKLLCSYLGEEEGTRLAQWLAEPEQTAIRELCRAPFSLRLLAHVYGQKRDSPIRLVDLYDRYIYVVVKREQELQEQDWPLVLLVEPLTDLALELQELGMLETWEGDVYSTLARFPEGRATAALRMAEGANLLRITPSADPRGSRVRFRHQLWQEDMAARAMLRYATGDATKLFTALQPHLQDDRWTSVVTLAAARLENAIPFLELLLDINAWDKRWRSRILLAKDILAKGGILPIGGILELSRGNRSGQGPPQYLVNMVRVMELIGKTDLLAVLAYNQEIDPWVRVEAARSLANLGLFTVAASVLLAIVRDPGSALWVRTLAASSLVHFCR